MAVCRQVYLDLDGNPSEVYYSTIKTSGPVAAEKAYIEHMMSMDPRFSIDKEVLTHIDRVKKKSKNLKHTKDEQNYTDGYNVLKRITTVVDGLKSKANVKGTGFVKAEKFDEDQVAREQAIKSQEWKIFGDEKPTDEGLRSRMIADHQRQFPNELDELTNAYKMSWEGSRQWGDHFHLFFQRAFEERNKILKKDPEADIKIGKLANTTKYNMLKKGEWKHGIKQEGNYQDILDIVMKEIAEIEAEHGPVTILPELKLSNKNLGHAGTADVVLITEQGVAFIIDFKSKTKIGENGSYGNFDRAYQTKFGGPFESLRMDSTPANSAIVQMSYYAAALKEEGFTISPKEALRTVVLAGDFYYQTDKKGTTDNKFLKPWEFKNIKVEEIRRTDSLHQHILGDSAEMIQDLERARSEGIYGFVDKIATPEARADAPQDTHRSNLAYIRHYEDDAIKLKKRSALIEQATGRRYIIRNNPLLPKLSKIFLDEHKEEDVDKMLREDYRQLKADQLTLPNHVIAYFRSGGKDVTGVKDYRENDIKSLLKGISIDTHHLMKAEDYPGLESIGGDVLLATNRITGAISLFSVINAENNKIRFDYDGSKKNRTTIFGKYATNIAIEAEGASQDLIGTNSMHEFIALKLGYAAMVLKKNSPGKPLLIEHMRVGSATGGGQSTTDTYIKKEINKFQRLLKYMPDSEIPADVKDLVSDPTITLDSSYGFAHTEHMKKIIEKHGTILKGFNSVSGLEQSIADRFEQWQQGDIIDPKLKRDLAKYRQEYISYKDYQGSEEKRNLQRRDPGLLLLDRVITEVNEFNVKTLQLAANSFRKNVARTAMTGMDAIMEQAQIQYNIASSNIRKDFDVHDAKHKALLKNFLDEAKDQGITSRRKAFEALYEDPKFADKKRAENFMRLKSTDNMTPAAKAYVEFILDSIDKNYESILTPKEYEKYKSNETWTRGLVPIVKATKSLTDSKTWDSFEHYWDAMKHNVAAFQKKHYDPHMAFGFGYEHASAYKEQLGTYAGSQHGKSRGEALGIDSDNKVPYRDIELDLGIIINNMAVTTSEQEHMAAVTQTLEAVGNALSAEDKNGNTHTTVKNLDNWSKMVIENKFGTEQGTEVKVLDTIGRGMSFLYFSGAIRQFFTESFTGLIQGTSSVISNSTLRLIDKNSGRFTAKDYIWGLNALRAVGSIKPESKHYQMIEDGNMVHADPAQLKQKEYASMSKAAVFISRPMHYLNQYVFNSSVGATYLAEMRSKGIDKAYEEYEAGGLKRWRYNEAKDPRFYVYDESRPGWGKATPPVTATDKKKHALWKAVRQDLQKEGGINSDGNMTVPMTGKERTSIKYYATKLYGSFHKDKEIQENAYAIVRAMTRYKAWFIQKGANYWMKSDESISRGEWQWVPIEGHPEGGVMQWTGLQNEGILQSVGHLVKSLYDMRSIAAFGKLNSIQKENLGKLLSDLLLVGIILSIASDFLLKEDTDFAKSETGKSLRRGLKNATADLNIVSTAITMGDSTFPAIDMAISSVENIKNIFIGTLVGNFDKAGEAVVKVGNTVGGVNSGKIFKELVTGFQQD